MKKRILIDLLQYIGAVALVVCTLLVIFAFNAGKLPFMSEDYLDTRKEAVNNEAADKDEENTVSEQETVQETAASFVARLDKVNADSLVSSGIYSLDSYIAARSLNGISITADSSVDVCMGYLIVKENGAVTAVYDSYLNNVTDALNGYTFTFSRDAGGRPLFYGADGYVFLDNGETKAANYDKYNCDKGLMCEYPSYLAGYNTGYTVFEEAGLFGLRKVDDGKIVIPAKYVDVYGVSEGYSIAVDKDNRLYLFTEEGELISNRYYVTDDDSFSSTGYFFVRNGITRARKSNGEEVMLRTDGSVFKIPSGFSVVSYSDGIILLKGQSGYGYMHYNGKWLCEPNYQKAFPFSEGLAVVCDEKGLYGMIDLNGDTVIPHLFGSLNNCSDGVILAYDQKFGYFLLNKVVK